MVPKAKNTIKVLSPVPWIEHLVKLLDRSKTFQALCATVDGKHTGKGYALKQPQHYPETFGEQVASEYMRIFGAAPATKPTLAAVEDFISKHDLILAQLDKVHAWLD